MLNGVESADLNGFHFAGIYNIEHKIIDKKHHSFRIFTGVEIAGKKEAIVIKTLQDLVAPSDAKDASMGPISMVSDAL